MFSVGEREREKEREREREREIIGQVRVSITYCAK